MPSSVHVDAHRGWGGGQVQSLGLALALSATGEQTWFVSQADSVLASRLGSTYLEWEAMPLRGLPGLGTIPRLARRLSALSPDIVHIHDSASHVVAGLAARLATNPKVVVTRRTELPLRGAVLGTAKYRLWCDRVICISEAVRGRCLQAGLHAGKLSVIPDFVDCRWFDPMLANAIPPGSGAAITTVGRLTRTKGYRVLLQAMRRVLQAVPEARLFLCGSGEEEDTLRHETAALGLTPSVTFAGFVADVRATLARADIFVMPSVSEGLGVAVLEAMAMGRPVVASATGGLPEAVVDGETGLLVPPGEPAALAEALVSLLRDPRRARQMGEAGRERALAHFDRPRIVPRILALYEELVSGGAP